MPLLQEGEATILGAAYADDAAVFLEFHVRVKCASLSNKLISVATVSAAHCQLQPRHDFGFIEDDLIKYLNAGDGTMCLSEHI